MRNDDEELARWMVRMVNLQERAICLLRDLHDKADKMALSEQDAIDAITSEQTDLTSLGSLLAKLFAAVEALRTTPPASPDFTKVVNAVIANHDLVTAALQGATAEDTKVEPPAPTLSVSPTSLALTVGGATASISASASDGSAPVFASSDATIATVDASGVVSPVASGSCSISVTTPTITTASTVSVVVS